MAGRSVCYSGMEAARCGFAAHGPGGGRSETIEPGKALSLDRVSRIALPEARLATGRANRILRHEHCHYADRCRANDEARMPNDEGMTA